MGLRLWTPPPFAIPRVSWVGHLPCLVVCCCPCALRLYAGAMPKSYKRGLCPTLWFTGEMARGVCVWGGGGGYRHAATLCWCWLCSAGCSTVGLHPDPGPWGKPLPPTVLCPEDIGPAVVLDRECRTHAYTAHLVTVQALHKSWTQPVLLPQPSLVNRLCGVCVCVCVCLCVLSCWTAGLGRGKGWSGGWAWLGWAEQSLQVLGRAGERSDPIQCGIAVSKAVLPVPSPQLTLRRAAARHAPLVAPTERRLLALDMLCLSCLMTN